MFNQTPRMWMPSKSQTPEIIGPSTYVLCDKRPLVNRIPFLSSDIRKPTFIQKLDTDAIYTLPDETIRGGTSPRFTASRSAPEACPTPGPADYDVTSDTTKTEPIRHGKGRLYHRVALGSKRSGPSVPTKINENGYWLDDKGNIYRIPSDFNDTSLGPAFYRVNEKTSYHYRGCKWSNRTSKRQTYTIRETPGPGEYELQKLIDCQEIENQTVREMAKKKSYLPRYLDQMMCKNQRENLPGPASYTPKDFKCNLCASIFPKPFLTASERFKYEVNDTPGPQNYSVKEVKYPVSKIKAPFSKCTPRFPIKANETGPGPGHHYIRSPLEEKLRYHNNDVIAQVAPFGISAGRFNSLSRDTYCFPSPADYTVDSENKCRVPVSSIFKSKGQRFSVAFAHKATEKGLKLDPIAAFNNITNKKSHNASTMSFGTKAPCIRLFDIFDDGTPGPPDTHHSKKSEPYRCRGFIFPISPRFSDRDECLPGPAYYNIHPSQTRAIYKAFDTHNLSVKESILKKKLKKHPRDTWENWAKTLKKNKQMRWFLKGAEYTH